jgi:hypothetical protein
MPPASSKWSRGPCRTTGISYRPLRAEDAEAVFDAAWEAWRFTSATIFAVFVDQFVRTNYAPRRGG